MKKLFTLLSLVLLAFALQAQVPDAINYQAVARDAAGNVLANSNVSVRLSIRTGSATGAVAYSETHAITTNQFGLFTVKIGQGVSTSPSFSTIDWGANTHFVQVEFDETGGTNYTTLGTSQLITVPYAFHARTVENDLVDDADADPANEIQVLSQSGNSLSLSNGGGTILIDADSTNELQTLSQNGDTVTLSQGGGSFSINDADADPANEIQSVSLSGSTVTLSQGGGSFAINDADADPTNEYQTLTYSNDSLTLSNGNTVVISGGDNDWLASGTNDQYSSVAGNVGIGVAAPTSKLHVFDNSTTGPAILGVNNSRWAVEGNGTLNAFGYLGVQGQTDFDGVTTADWAGQEIGVVGISNGGSTTDNYGVVGHSNGWGGRFENTSLTRFVELGGPSFAIRIVDGSQASGRVLTSDASGNATWAAPGGGGLWTDNGTNLTPSGGEDVFSGGDFRTNAIDGALNCGGSVNQFSNVIGDGATPSQSIATGDEDLWIEDDLEVVSQAYKTGGGSWATISDRRLKTNIQPYQDGLATVIGIKPVWFEYNEKAQLPEREQGRKFVGVLAQEIQAVAPYMVEEKQLFQKVRETENGVEQIIEEGEAFLTYDPSALDYMLINSVKELNDMIKKQNELLDAQSAKIKALEEQLNSLKGEK